MQVGTWTPTRAWTLSNSCKILNNNKITSLFYSGCLIRILGPIITFVMLKQQNFCTECLNGYGIIIFEYHTTLPLTLKWEFGMRSIYRNHPYRNPRTVLRYLSQLDLKWHLIKLHWLWQFAFSIELPSRNLKRHHVFLPRPLKLGMTQKRLT